MKKFAVLSSFLLFSSLALGANKKEQIIECKRVIILKVETNDKGEQKTILIHPNILKCEPIKELEEYKPSSRPPRIFPKQP